MKSASSVSELKYAKPGSPPPRLRYVSLAGQCFTGQTERRRQRRPDGVQHERAGVAQAAPRRIGRPHQPRIERRDIDEPIVVETIGRFQGRDIDDLDLRLQRQFLDPGIAHIQRTDARPASGDGAG